MALAMAYCAMFKTDFPIVYGSFQHFAMNKTGFASSILMCIAHQGTSQGEALQRWRCCTGTHIVCMHRQVVTTLCGVAFGFNTWPLPMFVGSAADQSCSCRCPCIQMPAPHGHIAAANIRFCHSTCALCHIGCKEMNFLFTKQGFQLQLN